MREPGGVLGGIAAAKRVELARRLDGVSIDALRANAESAGRSLVHALARPGARFILEIKRASPSGGAIRRSADPAVIARGYGGVADALSVLCDAPFFGGSLDDLRAARTVFDGPILAKDFFIDPRQVAEARIAGADAILVIFALLDDHEAREMIGEARRFGMDALVEVHDEAEMRRGLALGAPLIGINNRNLRDLSVDLATTEQLAKLAPDRVLVSESGISARDEVERLGSHVDAFLVGSSLMRSADPAAAARQVAFGRVILCGLNCAADL
jgi:indole-3-glycerol phosphate synthase/phosphoribosylanthranilate isomerase